MKLVDAFLGTPQSKYAAVAILIAVLVVSISVLFTKEKIPIGQKIGIALLIILISIPSILYTLFQMTCIVTGSGANGETWWCGVYAWILLAIIIIYAILVITMVVMSLVAERNMKETENFYNNKEMYDNFASEMVAEAEEKKMEHYSGRPEVAAGKYKSDVEGYSDRPEMPAGAFKPVVAPTVDHFTSCGAPLTPTAESEKFMDGGLLAPLTAMLRPK